jgi:hypothetical protein
MSRRSTTTLLVSCALGLSACSEKTSTAVDQPTGEPSPNLARPFDNSDGWLLLVPLNGSGWGRIRATRIAHPTTPGNFAVHVEIKLRDVLPNLTLVVQRAPETLPPFGVDATTTDGSCQRGLGIAPWSTITPTAPAAFVAFPLTVPTPSTPGPVTLTTDAAGRADFSFDFAATVPLPAFDVMFRLVEVGTAPRAVLVSQCRTLPT